MNKKRFDPKSEEDYAAQEQNIVTPYEEQSSAELLIGTDMASEPDYSVTQEFVDPTRDDKDEDAEYVTEDTSESTIEPTDEHAGTSVLDEFTKYLEFVRWYYGKSYFDGTIGLGVNYINGYGGTWYDKVVKWLDCGLAFSGRSVLDLGCAVGAYVNAISKYTNLIGGIDISADAIAIAKNNLPELPFVCLPLHEIAGEKHVDVIICCETIEHSLPQLNDVIADKIATLLTDGGLLYLQAPMFETEEALDAAIADETKDKGHINLQLKQYWVELFQSVGLTRDTETEGILNASADEFIKQHNWNYLVFKK